MFIGFWVNNACKTPFHYAIVKHLVYKPSNWIKDCKDGKGRAGFLLETFHLLCHLEK